MPEAPNRLILGHIVDGGNILFAEISPENHAFFIGVLPYLCEIFVGGPG